MRPSIIIAALLCCILRLQALGQEIQAFCAAEDPTTEAIIQPISGSTRLAVLLVDFPDGRLANGQPPANVSELEGLNTDAVGSLGWGKDSTGQFIKLVRKSSFKTYWEKIFSTGSIWADNDLSQYHPHPDFESHGVKVYGSFKEYWSEVSYGNLMTEPAITHTGYAPEFQGIINDTLHDAQGRALIKWIQVKNPKPSYPSRNDLPRLAQEAIDSAKAKYGTQHNLDIDAHFASGGKLMVVWAGGYMPDLVDLAEGVPGRWFIGPEKILHNSNSNSTFNGFAASAHEFGHLLGWRHEADGTYGLMNRANRMQTDCPPHPNPRFKLMEGWISEAGIVRVTSPANISLPPIETTATCLLLTIYGDAGRDNNWTHSEYLIIENRQRVGFDRFIGGGEGSAPAGGLLVWRYSSSGVENLPDIVFGSIQVNFRLIEADNNANAHNTRGEPSDFFPGSLGKTELTASTAPSTNSRVNLNTGISITSITATDSNITFSLDYTLGFPPSYDVFFYRTGLVPSSWFGKVYLDYALAFGSGTLLTVADLTEVEFAPNAYLTVSDGGNIQAVASSPQGIKFRGCGYGANRVKWQRILLTNPSSTSTFEMRNCLISDAIEGVRISALVNPVVIFKQNSFSNCDVDMHLYHVPFDLDLPATELAGLDENNFTTMHITGYWKLEAAPTFVVPAGAMITLKPPNTPVTIASGRLLQVNGVMVMEGSARLNFLAGSGLNVYGALTVSGNSTIDGGSVTLQSGGARFSCHG